MDRGTRSPVRVSPVAGTSSPAPEATYFPGVRLLFVCTGNLCRSAVAERLTLARAARSLAGSPELARVEVVSAGVHAEDGARMDPLSARALQALGGDPAGFASRRLPPSWPGRPTWC